MKTFISAEGLLEIPEAILQDDVLQPGQRCEIERVGEGEYRVKVADENGKPEQSVLEWLLSCPVKDWYLPMERRETTDDLKPNIFE